MPVTRAAARFARLEAGGGVTAVLPDELLGGILCLAGIESGPAVARVCHRWRRVFYSRDCSSLWRHLTVGAYLLSGRNVTDSQAQQWWAAKHSLIKRVAPWVQAVSVRGAQLLQRRLGALEVEQLLRQMHPASLRSLALDCDCTCRMAQALRRLTSLTTVRISISQSQQPKHLAAALGNLPQLQSLNLTAWDLPGSEVAACFPPQLTALKLSYQHYLAALAGFPHSRLPVLARLCLTLASLNPSLVSDLSQLSSVTHLEMWSHASPLTPAVLGPLANMQQLCSLQLRCRSTSGGCRLRLLQQQLAAFPHLTQFVYSDIGEGQASIRAGNARISHISQNVRAGPEAGMELDIDAEGVQSLRRLLAHLLLPGTPLVQLSLESQSLTAEALRSCSQLTALTALQWEIGGARNGDGSSSAEGQGGSTRAAVKMLLRKAPHLAELTLFSRSFLGVKLASVPSCLARYQGLRKLDLSGLGLHMPLPQGECWKGLLELDLSINCLLKLPKALMAATSLRTLLLDDNAELQLREKDVRRTLACMPRLRLLSLRGTMPPHPTALDLLRIRMPLLEVLV